jgi:hypothetical protein
MKLNESLKSGDLRNLVDKVFGIDGHTSKIGNDEDTVVLSFTVRNEEPAKDLENFVEMGFTYVLDADVTPGEGDDGKYQVFVELERSRHVAEQIHDIIEGIKKLTDMDEMRFRYFKGFKSRPATLPELTASIPKDRNAYKLATEEHKLNNFSEFFRNSYADKMIVDESLQFKSTYGERIKFDIVNSGPKNEVYDSIKGPIMLEHRDISEVLFLTKLIGNYNITKISDTFIFENSGWAVALKRK